MTVIENKLTRIANAAQLPGQGSLVETIRLLCEEPTEANKTLARHIAKRGRLLVLPEGK